jgi:hypothetical protein
MTYPGSQPTNPYGPNQPTQQQSAPPYPQSPAPAGYGQPYQQPQYGQPYPPQGYQQMPPQMMYVREPKNGLGLTALICAIVGLALCIIPILGAPVGGPLSIVAIITGLVGFSRARKGVATNRKVALWGLILGCLAFVAAIGDAVIIFTALDHVSNCLDSTSNALNNAGDAGAQATANAACQN